MNLSWVSRAVVLAIHDEQIAEHGGPLGLRDEGLLDSALARPQNVLHYTPDADLGQVAAAYALGLAKNHAFVDGNKRVSFVVMETFLLLNGCQLVADDAECVHVWLAMASGKMDDEDFTAWLRSKIRSIAPPDTRAT